MADSTKITVALNEIHKPSVSFVELESGEDLLSETVLNGKVYFTKSFLRDIGWKGERLNITVSKGELVRQ